MTNKVSLTQFIIEQQRGLPDASGTFSLLLNNIVTACKEISHLVNRGDLVGAGDEPDWQQPREGPGRRRQGRDRLAGVHRQRRRQPGRARGRGGRGALPGSGYPR